MEERTEPINLWKKCFVSFLKKIILTFIYLLAVQGVGCFIGFSLVAVHRLPIAVASLVAEHRLFVLKRSVV